MMMKYTIKFKIDLVTRILITERYQRQALSSRPGRNKSLLRGFFIESTTNGKSN